MQPIHEQIEQEYAAKSSRVLRCVDSGGQAVRREISHSVIPTQWFLDKDGKEYFRHEGYFPKQELVKVPPAEGCLTAMSLFDQLTGACNKLSYCPGRVDVWGVLSILLSPCHLSSIPLIVGSLTGRESYTKKRAFRSPGFLPLADSRTIAAIRVVTGMDGRIMATSEGGTISSPRSSLSLAALARVITIPFWARESADSEKERALAALTIDSFSA